jgi:hypothetical protein
MLKAGIYVAIADDERARGLQLAPTQVVRKFDHLDRLSGLAAFGKGAGGTTVIAPLSVHQRHGS